MNNGRSDTCEGNFHGEMTLRQWVGRPGRVVDRVESLHIFRQILDLVNLAHVQGIILRNIRPSCFVLSPFNRVAFIDSAGTRSSSDRSSERSTDRTSVSQVLRDERHDDDGPVFDPFESTSHRRPVVGVAEVGGQRSNWSVSSSGEGVDQAFVAHHGTGRHSTLVGYDPTTGVQNSATWMQEWTGSSGSEVLADSRGAIDFRPPRTSLHSRPVGAPEAGSGSQESFNEEEEEESLMREERFPQRELLLREQTWYASPEELMGGTCSFGSDVYSLGVLFFELFCPLSTETERARVMADLRHRILSPRLLSECPKEASFCLWLLHPDPSKRPKARDVLQSELLSEAGEALAERQAAISVEERAAESDLLLDFLLRMQHEKQDAAMKLGQDVSRLTSDIEEVERRRSSLKERGHPFLMSERGDRFHSMGCKEESFLRTPTFGKGRRLTDQLMLVHDGRKPSFAGKRSREEGTLSESKWEGPSISMGDISSKSARLMNNFTALEKVYFSMRWRLAPNKLPSESESPRASSPFGSQAGGSSNGGGVGGNILASSRDHLQGRDKSDDWLGCFFDSLCKYARYSRFEVKATLRHSDLLNTTNMVCSLSFDRDEQFFATAGVCKRIKIFECEAVLNEHVDIHYPVVEMMSRSKLSSVCWNSYIKSHVASSDYEGIVQLWDANTSQTLMEFEEHDKRAWSVDFSRADPTKLASGSDDGCVKLWSINQDTSTGTIKTRANVCCVQFPPDTSHLLVFGSADYKMYCYDLRTTKAPLCVMASHNKAVSYVKFVDPVTIVSASTDNTLKLWDLTQASSSDGTNSGCSLTYTGHLNEKNFVGLTVADGYIACGSEKNSVFAYHKSLPMPMASHKFGSADPITGLESDDDGGQFVSSVCWRGKSQTLVAANSMGNIKVLEMV